MSIAKIIKNLAPITLIILTLFLFSGCDLKEHKTPEPTTSEYEVVSVSRYIKTYTNRFGGVNRQEPVYCFAYIDKDNVLHEIDNFKHTEYGLTKVTIGDENKYIIQDGIDTYRTLILTEKTLSNIEVQNNVSTD